MSTIKNPVGRQPSKVYWRRRLVLVLGVLAVLVIVFLIIVRPGSSTGQPADPPASAGAGAGEATDAPAEASPDPATSAPTAACEAANVQVEAITDAINYEPGQSPEFSLSVTNTGTSPCELNAGTAAQVFTVTSGKDVYWRSTDCQTDAEDTPVTLEPGVPISSAEPLAWERVRSSKDTCETATRDAATAGGASYYLKVSVDGIESETPKQFLLY